MAKHSVPAGQDHFDARSLIRQHIASDIQDILTGGYPARGRISTTLNPAQAAADRSNFDQLKRAFQVCMANTPALGLRDLGDVLNTIASLYPVGSKDNAAASLGRTLAFLAQAGIQPLVVFELPNPKVSPGYGQPKRSSCSNRSFVHLSRVQPFTSYGARRNPEPTMAARHSSGLPPTFSPPFTRAIQAKMLH